MLPQMGFEPTFPGLLVGCDDHYITATTMLAAEQSCGVMILTWVFPGSFSFKGWMGKPITPYSCLST